jgi:ABC-type Fe3+-hydroxamate transport system substrate-binding protein
MKKNNRSKEIDRKKEKEEIIENLSAQIFGDFGKTAEVKVSDKKVNCIDPGVDVFHFHSENSDLGSLFKIKLTQTNPKKNKPIWYLERIRVLHNKQVWSFPYQRWITMNKKEKKKEIKIFEEVGKLFS